MRHEPHYCEHHPSSIAWRGPVRGKFYCDKCREIAYAEQAKSNRYGESISTADTPAQYRKLSVTA